MRFEDLSIDFSSSILAFRFCSSRSKFVVFNFSTSSLEGLLVKTPEESLKMAKSALKGDHEQASAMVSMAAGAALYVSDIANSLESGVDLAKSCVELGGGIEKLNQLVEFTTQIK